MKRYRRDACLDSNIYAYMMDIWINIKIGPTEDLNIEIGANALDLIKKLLSETALIGVNNI